MELKEDEESTAAKPGLREVEDDLLLSQDHAKGEEGGGRQTCFIFPCFMAWDWDSQNTVCFN